MGRGFQLFLAVGASMTKISYLKDVKFTDLRKAARGPDKRGNYAINATARVAKETFTIILTLHSVAFAYHLLRTQHYFK